MAEGFHDFFRELPHCLKPEWTRDQNYNSLREQLEKVRNRLSQDARLEQARLNEAMPVFKNEQRYRDWRKQWEAERRGGSKREGEDEASHRKAEMAHERARKAEEAQRREAERARALKRELEEAKQQAAQAEREKEEAAKASKRPLWAEVGLRIFDHALSRAKPPDSSGSAPAPQRPLWAEVGLKILDQALSRANPPDSISSAPAPHSLQPVPIDLTGDWIADDGSLFSAWQNGGQIRVQGKNMLGQVLSDGHGQFDGRQFRMQYRTAPIPTPMGSIPTVGEWWGEVSADGSFIRSQGINQTLGQPFQMVLRRRR